MTEKIERNAIVKGVGKGGLPFISLKHITGYEATVLEHGAHITSWAHPSGTELLFMSERAIFEKGAAIRGGIPIVFPQFGKGELPSHGFARNRSWKVVREHLTETDAVSVTLRLAPEPEVLEMWPHAFVIEYDVVLSDVLVTTMRIVNGGTTPFEFRSALHTYFNVGDVTTASVGGLQSVSYVDFLRERKEFVEDREQVTIDAEVDRAYANSPESVSINAPQIGMRFTVTKENFSDTVVWNPWKGSASMPDLGPGGYRGMLCVESANALASIPLEAGQVHTSGQVLRAEPIG